MDSIRIPDKGELKTKTFVPLDPLKFSFEI